MYFVCAGCGQCFYLTVPGGNLKGHIIHFSWNQENTKFAQLEFHAFEHGPLLEALFFTDGDGLILIVLHTMGRHNYLHITKLSQTVAARNQQVSVNDKRCLSKRKRISQLAAATALQTSRSGWIWEGYNIVTQRLLELIGPSWDYNFQVPRAARQLAAQLMMINSEGWSCRPILHCAPSVSVWCIMPRYDREFHRFEE